MGLVSYYTMLLMIYSKEMIQDNFLLLSLPLVPHANQGKNDGTGRLRSKSKSVSGDGRGLVSASFDHISKGGGLFIYSMLGEVRMCEERKTESEATKCCECSSDSLRSSPTPS